LLGLLRIGRSRPDFYEFIDHLLDETSPPVVTRSWAEQRRDGTGIVDVYYDLVSYDSTTPHTVSVDISDDDGETFLVENESLRGDYDEGVLAGPCHVESYN